MALERISNISRVPVARGVQVSVQPGLPGPQEQLRLLLSATQDGTLLGRTADGRAFDMGTAGIAPHLLVPGQRLLVRVLRTSPSLEFTVLDHAGTDADAQPDGEPPALRVDQAGMRRWSASVIDPPALASGWRAMALAQLRQAGTVMQDFAPQGAVALPADSLTEPNASALRVMQPMPALPQQPPAATEFALLLHPQLWHGWPLQLWLVQRRAAFAGTNRRAARRHGTRLRLALELHAWGPLGIEIDVLDVQVALSLQTAQTHMIAPLRDRVGAIAQRLAAVGLRLVRCHVEQDDVQMAPAEGSASAAAATMFTPGDMPLVLFRAAAEVLAAF